MTLEHKEGLPWTAPRGTGIVVTRGPAYDSVTVRSRPSGVSQRSNGSMTTATPWSRAREFLEPFARLVQRLDRDADGTVTQEMMRAQREDFRDRRGDRRELVRRSILAVGRYRADVRT